MQNPPPPGAPSSAPPDAETMTVGKRITSCCSLHWPGSASIFIPLIFLPLLFMDPPKEYRCMFVVVVMAFYWVTELIPLYVTSLLPILCFPVMDILESNEVCYAYFNDSLMLFTGGLIVALAIEYSNLHRRIALGTIVMVGCCPRRLHFGLIFVTMFFSMWMSNGACTAMMCPIIKAVLSELETQGTIKLTIDKPLQDEDDPPYPSKAVMCFYLGVAYASTIGGSGTLIGTGTNLSFKGLYDTRFPDNADIDFAEFMMFATLPMLIETFLTYFWLQWLYMGWLRPSSPEAQEINISKEVAEASKAVINTKYNELGKVNPHEMQVILIFIVMTILKFTHNPGMFPGWAELLDKKVIKGSNPIMLAVVIMFLLPINYVFMKYWICRRPDPEKRIPSVLSWKFVHDNLPWGLLFLLGGGFALAEGVKSSGFSVMVGDALTVLERLPVSAIQFISLVASIFLTAFSSNVSICHILIPVLSELCVAIKVHPLYLTLPAALGCGMAFHLPVSTPPNAIASGFAGIRSKDMAIAGIGPTVVTLIFTFIASQSWMFVVWPSVDTFPDWAHPSTTTVAPPGGG